ncbi:pentatricopeptide repeat protein [Teratosphaeria destructans]|uniref:Pentatricopeptide repeat protein n=1 Tax=Teratosphaeria destructans TaxID=418781 RepID=A0A9W7SMX1_9PEZI|nr:pentatricopeptide repeat protein [Teratosphaeria destructans]
MPPARLVIDPLWQCLCPAWSRITSSRLLRTVATRPSRCLNQRPFVPPRRSIAVQVQRQDDGGDDESRIINYNHPVTKRRLARDLHSALEKAKKEPTPYLYTKLRALAIKAQVREVRALVEHLIQERHEKPDVNLYTALILSNVSATAGAAWRVLEYLEEMKQANLEPDNACCHAILRVLAVHPDHLLRADVLEYMRNRWLELNEEGMHDVAAGLLREGLFEQAMNRIDGMQREGVQVQPWLLDMAVYMLCAAGEVEEAHRVMRQRFDRGEMTLSRIAWHTLLDTGSYYRHHPSTALVWNSQVNTGYMNPASGICLNVLVTASQAGDAVLATDVFSQLSKRGVQFQLIHYQLLMDCYLNTANPDLTRALSILTIMTIEKVKPTVFETRALFNHMRNRPDLVKEAFKILKSLHDQGREIPLAALNLLIECHVEQKNLDEALRIYKLMHSFAPPSTSSTHRTFVNVETFNLLLKGCRVVSPPDEAQASFLVSELLALRIMPTPLTYDRLILVFIEAAVHTLQTAAASSPPNEPQQARGLELLDWAFRHFADMRAVSADDHSSRSSTGSVLGWMPRFGTVESLAVQLAKVGDGRCWDVLQAGEDVGGEGLDGWEMKGKWVRRNVEQAWAEATRKGSDGAEAPVDAARQDSSIKDVANVDVGFGFSL